MEHCGMGRCSHVTVQTHHWIDPGHHPKTICILGWQNKTKTERNRLIRKMQKVSS